MNDAWEDWDAKWEEAAKAVIGNLVQNDSAMAAIWPEILELVHLGGFFYYVNKYDPEFGDERLCLCGHSYYRHFDTYEDMRPVGCKYCGGMKRQACGDFYLDYEEWAKAGRPGYSLSIPKVSDPLSAENRLDDEILYPAWMERDPVTGEVPE